tara:strand:- start:2886 stop:3059 length:174 start_codon:yes stop_codon:yes gene_type:complete
MQYLTLAYLIWKRLHKARNRKTLLLTLQQALQDGKFSPIEWAKLGSELGIFDDNATT